MSEYIEYKALTKKQKMEVLRAWPLKGEQTTHYYQIDMDGSVLARVPEGPGGCQEIGAPVERGEDEASEWAEVKEARWEDLTRSPMNPRKHFPDGDIDKLALSIRRIGLVSALLVRPLPDGRLEIVCGECRHRGCDERPHPFEAGVILPRVEMVRVDVRVLSDKEVLELMLTENIQRRDLTPLEECDAFCAALKSAGPAGEPIYTVDTLADQIGCSPDYVRQRCALSRLNKEGRKALHAGAISFATARVVCGCPAGIIEGVLDVVLHPEKHSVWHGGSGYLTAPLNEEQAAWVIHERFVRDLGKAAFDMGNGMLVPAHFDGMGQRLDGGSCGDCPWNSAVSGGRKFSKAKLCLNPECYAKKIEVNVASQLVKAGEAGEQVLSTAEGEAALRDGSYVRLAESPDLDDLANGVDEAPAWGELVTGETMPPVVVAVDKAGHVHRLVERRLAVAAAQSNGNAHYLGLGGGRAASVQEADAAEQSRRKREDAKNRNLVSFEAMGELLALVSASEPELFWDWLVDVAANAGGQDAAFFACKRRGEPNGIDATAAVDDYAIACKTPGEKRALACELLMARSVRFRGVDAEHFEALAGIYGLNVGAIEKRVLGNGKDGNKGKNGKKAAKAAEAAPEMSEEDLGRHVAWCQAFPGLQFVREVQYGLGLTRVEAERVFDRFVDLKFEAAVMAEKAKAAEAAGKAPVAKKKTVRKAKGAAK